MPATSQLFPSHLMATMGHDYQYQTTLMYAEVVIFWGHVVRLKDCQLYNNEFTQPKNDDVFEGFVSTFMIV